MSNVLLLVISVVMVATGIIVNVLASRLGRSGRKELRDTEAMLARRRQEGWETLDGAD